VRGNNDFEINKGSSAMQADLATLLNRMNCRKCFDAFLLLDILYELQANLTSKVPYLLYSFPLFLSLLSYSILPIPPYSLFLPILYSSLFSISPYSLFSLFSILPILYSLLSRLLHNSRKYHFIQL
jgi:hypothetical protein